MFIVGLGTAAPAQVYHQRECWDVLQHTPKFHELAPRSRAILRKVLSGDNGIATRHLALDSLDEAFRITPDALQARFAAHAPRLAAQAAERALANAGVQPASIDAVAISTCTGYLCPGLSSYVAEVLRLRPDVLTLDLVGQGCGAAVPNLRTADALLTSGRCAAVLSICVEVCSAAFFFDDDPGVLVSACLFGDGAGAAVLSNTARAGKTIEWQSAVSVVSPAERDLLRFRHEGGMLRNVLSTRVPELAARHAAAVLEEELRRSGLRREEISGWLIHPGGRDVLKAVAGQLRLSDADLRWSAAVLKEFGNISSSSLYFVLEAALNDSAPAGYWWMATFGAGFSCHGALLKVT